MARTQSSQVSRHPAPRLWIGLGVAVVVLTFLGLLLYGMLNRTPLTGASGAMREGKPAPDFNLPDFNGQLLRLADLRGQGVVLYFWASWCAPCRAEAPSLNAAYAKYRDRGVTFVGINFWNLQETEADARAFIQEFNIAYPLVRDVEGNTSLDYGVSGIPVTFFIDKEGIVVRRWVGPLDEGRLDTLIASITPPA